MRIEKVEFPNRSGERLAARLDLPDGTPRAFALFAHCFTCSKDIFAASRISHALAERGVATLRFDFTGLGSSEGEFANTNFSSNVQDLLAAADFLRRRGTAPALLVGHSLGGSAMLKAAAFVPEAVAVVTIAAPADPEQVTRNFHLHLPTIESAGEAEVTLAGRTFRIRRQFLEDLAGQKLEDAIRSLRKALLVLHAPGDQVVGIDNASRIFAVARHPKSFVSLDDADHLLSRRADAIYVADVIAAWADRYLPAAMPPDTLPFDLLDLPPQGEVVVVETGEGTFPQHVFAGRHLLRADEPERLGGTDSGPDPYSYLLAALGACTSMTVRLYADRKQWPLERVAVRLRHAKIHAKDCAECETQQGMLDRIERRIQLAGPLDAAQKSRLLEIAERCPVHRTLHSEVTIVSLLDEQAEERAADAQRQGGSIGPEPARPRE